MLRSCPRVFCFHHSIILLLRLSFIRLPHLPRARIVQHLCNLRVNGWQKFWSESTPVRHSPEYASRRR
ncbi:hypothetical protein BDV93DRAFT_525290 [Ceratobasidium sp. AG-I]|nr:hypothetical protein BDV93DRAFT_525290 [Ceratobasidium sp. AG-I]